MLRRHDGGLRESAAGLRRWRGSCDLTLRPHVPPSGGGGPRLAHLLFPRSRREKGATFRGVMLHGKRRLSRQSPADYPGLGINRSRRAPLRRKAGSSRGLRRGRPDSCDNLDGSPDGPVRISALYRRRVGGAFSARNGWTDAPLYV